MTVSELETNGREMVWLICVGSTGDGIRTVEVAELMRRRWFDVLDLVGRSVRGPVPDPYS